MLEISSASRSVTCFQYTDIVSGHTFADNHSGEDGKEIDDGSMNDGSRLNHGSVVVEVGKTSSERAENQRFGSDLRVSVSTSSVSLLEVIFVTNTLFGLAAGGPLFRQLLEHWLYDCW